jgi:hypothetical protein
MTTNLSACGIVPNFGVELSSSADMGERRAEGILVERAMSLMIIGSIPEASLQLLHVDCIARV